jgi:hypothetical protein
MKLIKEKKSCKNYLLENLRQPRYFFSIPISQFFEEKERLIFFKLFKFLASFTKDEVKNILKKKIKINKFITRKILTEKLVDKVEKLLLETFQTFQK